MADYTLLHLLDERDIAPDHGLEQLLEARFVTEALGSTTIGLSHQRFHPGVRLPFGHTHSRQEEIYVILAGSGTANVDGTLVALAPHDALRVAPGTMRALESGPDGLELLAVGAPIGGERDSTVEQGWWPEG